MRDQHHVITADTLRDRILQLESEHSGLDRLIDKMSDEPGIDDFELQRLKKRKLKVKDTIILLQLQLEPDVRGLAGAGRASREPDFAGNACLEFTA
jgi:hypothetical protein